MDIEMETDVYLNFNCEVRIWDPHSGKRMSNQTYGVLNHAGLYLKSAGGKGSCPVLPRKIIEDRHWIPVLYE